MNRKQRRAAAKSGQSVGGSYGMGAAGAIPRASADMLEAGFKHLQAERLRDAEVCFRQVLSAHPGHPDASYLLGMIALQEGHAADAAHLIGHAVSRNKQNPFMVCNFGIALCMLKRFDEAIANFDRALSIEPSFALAHYNRGNALRELKRYDEALRSYEKAITLRPNDAELHNNRANTLQELKRFDEAVASYEKALEIKPDFALAFRNRGNALHRLKRFEEALASYDRALVLKPDYMEALNNKGAALRELHRLDEALVYYDKALALRPGDADLYNNRGNILLEITRFDEALANFDTALALNPGLVQAYNGRGNVLRELKRPSEAMACFDKALALSPQDANAFNNRGGALELLRKFDEALVCYEKALALQPDHPHALGRLIWCASVVCDWGGSTSLSVDAIVRATEQGGIFSPFQMLGYSGDPTLQLQCARNFAASKFQPQPLWTGATWRNDKLRIAYLSADFHQHATAGLMAGLFERHDRSRFEVIAVDFGVDDRSEMRKRIVAAFDRFIDVREKSEEAAARLLHDLKTDIVIDLKGHTQDSRPGILAHRPAPVQASYLGYPGTMGTPFIDYIIADRIVAPLEHQPFYTEKVVHLPDCYQVNDTKRPIAQQTPTRAEAQLPAEGFVFCCFNGNWKIAPDRFDVWMRLLAAVDGSVLWLLRDNESAERNLRNEAQKRGIDPARLVFASRLPNEEHLARHRLADLFLDTLPVNAHTTTSDALWAGLPVVTQLGESFAGRVAASLLNAIGLPELITQSTADYEALALQLARDPTLLEGYRRRLNTNRLTHPLFDTDRFRRRIETAYLQMWEIWQRGEQPRSFKVEDEGVCSVQ
ncbi:MAG: tetratricopeptide repeat protein [Rhodomicrobium sp.]